MKVDSFEELKFVLTAYDSANAQAMRLWYAASLVSVSILASVTGLDIQGLIGEAGFSIESALPALLIVLAALNFIFVVSQISHYRMAEVYQSIVYERFSNTDKISSRFTWRDLSLRAPIASYNRINPLFESFGMNSEWKVSKVLKFLYDCAFGLFPAFGLVTGLWKLSANSPFYVLNSMLGMLSVLASLAILRYAFLYAFKKPSLANQS